MSIENTCNFKECKFANDFFDKPEDCFNYVESWWTPADDSPPVLVKDCSSKRVFLMVQDLFNRLVGVQQSQEEQRNESTKMKDNMTMVMSSIAEVTGKENHKMILQFMKDDVKLIEDK